MFAGIEGAWCGDTDVCVHGENHELSRSGKPRNRIIRMQEILNWMDHYLKGGKEA